MLEAVLIEAQRRGMLGARPIPDVIQHARSFVDALDPGPHTVIDLGAGGGVPGLVIASFRPDVRITMVDRREKRTDFLQMAVRRLALDDQCEVWCRDVRTVARELQRSSGSMTPWDAVVARGFGPPLHTVALALELVTGAGRIVLSEPPADQGDRWPHAVLVSLGLRRVEPAPPGVAILVPVTEEHRA